MALIFDYLTEGVKEAFSRLPFTPEYDARNPRSPYYREPKSLVSGGRAITPSEFGTQNIGSPYPPLRFPTAGTGAAGDGGQAQGSVSDPFAKYGGKSAYDNLLKASETQKGNIFSTSQEAAKAGALGRKSSILDFIESLQSSQRGIDEQGVQSELARKQGQTSILDMVGRGLRSGGTMLANRNALDSSASEQLARAYGDIGRRELSGIGNQYEQEQRQIGLSQEDLGRQRGTGLRKFEEDKVQQVNSIVSEARNNLAALDAAMLEADLPTRIQIEQEKERIKGDVLNTLSQYDQMLAQRSAAVQPTSPEERRRSAAGLATAGVAAENPFEFSTEAPAQFQNTGPFPGQLPLFLSPRRRQE